MIDPLGLNMKFPGGRPLRIVTHAGSRRHLVADPRKDRDAGQKRESLAVIPEVSLAVGSLEGPRCEVTLSGQSFILPCRRFFH